jgi:hypothetical protein
MNTLYIRGVPHYPRCLCFTSVYFLLFASLPVEFFPPLILPNLKSQQFLSPTALKHGQVNPFSYSGTIPLFIFGFFVFVYVSWLVIQVALKADSQAPLNYLQKVFLPL